MKHFQHSREQHGVAEGHFDPKEQPWAKTSRVAVARTNRKAVLAPIVPLFGSDTDYVVVEIQGDYTNADTEEYSLMREVTDK